MVTRCSAIVDEFLLERFLPHAEPAPCAGNTRVSSGTYVRAIADALGGHCRTLRRLEVGPFSVEEADPEAIVPAADALARLALEPASGRGSS